MRKLSEILDELYEAEKYWARVHIDALSKLLDGIVNKDDIFKYRYHGEENYTIIVYAEHKGEIEKRVSEITRKYTEDLREAGAEWSDTPIIQVATTKNFPRSDLDNWKAGF